MGHWHNQRRCPYNAGRKSNFSPLPARNNTRIYILSLSFTPPFHNIVCFVLWTNIISTHPAHFSGLAGLPEFPCNLANNSIIKSYHFFSSISLQRLLNSSCVILFGAKYLITSENGLTKRGRERL